MSQSRACCAICQAVAIWLVLFGLLVGARYYTFGSAIVHDEGVFLYGGMAWAAGEVAYRDFWDHKPPGITLFHAIPIRLFGHSLLAVRLHEVFWLAVSATIFLYLCRAHLSAGPAILSLLFFALFVSMKLVIRSGGLTEESALTFHALSYLFALRRRGSLKSNFFLAGLFLGLAAQFRQPFGLSIVFIVLCLLWRPRGCEVALKRRIAVLPILAVGAALPEAVSSGYFALRGIWPEYIEASYLFNFLYMGGGPDALGLGDGLQKHWEMLKATGPYFLSPALVIPLVWWLPARLRRVGVLMIVAFLCDSVAISLGGRYYEHYYLQATISSSFLLGLMFQAMYEGLRPRVVRGRASQLPGPLRRGKTLRGVYLVSCILVGGLVLEICTASTAGAIKRYIRQYKAELGNRRQPTGELRTERALGKAIRTITEPDERILLLGASPTSVYFASGRLAGSRYYHLSPFFRKAFAQSMRKRHRERFLSDLKRRRPVLIILAREERQIYFAGIEVVENSAAAFLVPYLEEEYVSLEDFYPRSKIRETLWWTWYGRICSFRIRKDKVEEMKRRIQRAESEEL